MNNGSQIERIHEIIDAYPSFQIEEESGEYIKLSGGLNVHRCFEQFVLNRTYEIDIFISEYEGKLPYVVDRGKVVDSEYPHIYSDGKLCLATDIDMQMAFDKDPSLVRWIKDFVEPYFVSYEYYKRYGMFPVGERAHGALGILQSYMEIFNVDLCRAKQIILYLSCKSYRGNQSCPCGSGIRIRKCHGKVFLKFYNNPVLRDQVRADHLNILKRELQYGSTK